MSATSAAGIPGTYRLVSITASTGPVGGLFRDS